MSFERSYSIESHERIKLILIFGDKSLLLIWWVTVVIVMHTCHNQLAVPLTIFQKNIGTKNKRGTRPYITDRARDQRCIRLGRGLVESDIKVVPEPYELQYYDSLRSNGISIVTTHAA